MQACNNLFCGILFFRFAASFDEQVSEKGGEEKEGERRKRDREREREGEAAG